MTEVKRRPEGAADRDVSDLGPDAVEAIRAGDESTFARIVTFWSPFLLRTAMVLTGDRESAQAVVRETWLRVLGEVATFRPPPRPRAWVCSLMLGALDLAGPAGPTGAGTAVGPAVAPARFLPPDHEQWPGHWAVPPAVWPAMDDSRSGARGVGTALRSALAGLPAQQRVVVTLRDVAGCEVAEISQIVRQEPDEVRLLLHQGRSALRGRLETHFDEARSA
jgi:RNA polymerase sigma-70 factor (ECF subfamily)